MQIIKGAKRLQNFLSCFRMGCLAVGVTFAISIDTAMAAEDAAHEVGIDSLLSPAFNLTLYLIFLIFIYKKYLRTKVRDTAKNVADYIQRSAAHLAEAENAAAMVVKRKSRLDDEKQGIVLQYKKEGEIQKDRILMGAVEKSDAVASGVLMQAERELVQAKVAVQREIFKQALEVAGQKFKEMPPEEDRKVRAGVLESMLSQADA